MIWTKVAVEGRASSGFSGKTPETAGDPVQGRKFHRQAQSVWTPLSSDLAPELVFDDGAK